MQIDSVISKINKQLKSTLLIWYLLIGIVLIGYTYLGFSGYNTLNNAIVKLTEPSPEEALFQKITSGINKMGFISQFGIFSSGSYDLKIYDSVSLETKESLNKLPQIVTLDSASTIVDSLKFYLDQKDLLIKDYSKLKASYNQEAFPDSIIKQVENFLLNPKNSKIKIDFSDLVKVQKNSSTYVNEINEKSTFFKRFKNLFSPGKRKTQISVSQRDSLLRADTVLQVASESFINASGMRKLLIDAKKHNQILQAQLDSQAYHLLINSELLQDKMEKLSEALNEQLSHRINETKVEAINSANYSVKMLFASVLLAIVLGIGFLFLLFNRISVGKKYQLLFENEQIRATNLARNKEEILANLSHEIKTPIQSILGFSKIVKHKLPTSEKHLANNIEQSTGHLQVLVEDMLDFAALEKRKIVLKPTPFNPSDLFEALKPIYQERANEKGIKLNWQIDISDSLILAGDWVRIRQIVINLLDNAFKFTNQGVVSIIANYSSALEIEISDTGSGISEVAKEKIFQKFERDEKELHSGIAGLGLGLSIVKALLDLMEGTLILESTQGIGSNFKVIIPLPIGKLKEISHHNKSLNIDQSFKILLVDDDPLIRSLMEEVFKPTGINHTFAADGLIAQEMIQKHDFDLVITDWKMPNLDGITLFERFKNVQAKFVIASAGISEEEAKKLKSRGVWGFLPKPFDPNLLLIKVQLAAVSFQAETMGFDLTQVSAFFQEKQELFKYLQEFVQETRIQINELLDNLTYPDQEKLHQLGSRSALLALPANEFLREIENEPELNFIKQWHFENVLNTMLSALKKLEKTLNPVL